MLTKGLGRGGTERLLAGTVRHLDRARFEVEVAYLLPWKDAFVEEIEAAGVAVHCLGATRAGRVAWLPRLRRLVRDREIDLVHTHMPLPASAARLALPRTTFVHTEHNMWDRYRPATRLVNRVTYRRNASVIAVSDGVAASVRALVPVEVVVHGIDVANIRRDAAARSRARRALGLGEEGPVVGTVGNLTAKKDHASLLTATRRLADEHPGLRVVVVGSGPLEGELRARAAALGLADTVLFAGMRHDVFDLLAAFDVFTLSSRFEGLPIALLEAMATGVPPVATRVGGIPEVVTDGVDGTLVPPGDPEALATAIGKLLADPAGRAEMGLRATERATAFDLSAAVRRIEDVYQAALER